MEKRILRQIIMLSKYFVYGFTIQLFFTAVLLANTGKAQRESIHQISASIQVENRNLETVLKELEKQTLLRFTYNSSVLDVKKLKVDLDQVDKPLSEILGDISQQTHLKFVRINDNIHVSKRDSGESRINEFMNEEEWIEIRGVVTSAKDNSPIPGVTIRIKESQRGTVTDVDGNYSIEAAPGQVLVFSFVGYQPKEVTIANQSVIDIALEEDLQSLDEVVVVGYGTMKKSDLTGSISSINSEDFNKGPQLSTQQLIQGKIAGVNISKNSGKPGGSNTVRIRGGTSITASNDPLYVIDGVPISTSGGVNQANIGTSSTNFFDQEPTNPLMTLNPNDIESVIVLKDASATAIYGSRGANGVIMITTKKGREGRAQVTYDVSGGFSKVANTLDVLSADQYRETINELGLPLDDKGANTNWQDEVYRTAYQQNHYLSLMGGSEKTTYRASLGFGDQQGIMLGSSLEQANARININHEELEGKLAFDFRLNYGQNTSNQSPISNTVGSELGSSLNYEAYVFNPTYPVRDENGNYYHVPPFRVNPVSFSTDLIDERINRRFIGNLSTTYKIIDPLSFKVNLGYTRQGTDRNSFISKNNPLGQGFGGYTSVQKLADFSKLLETTLSFNETYGASTIDAVAGYSYQYFLEEGIRNTASGFLSDEFKWYSLEAASTISSVSSFVGSNTLISMYGRVNYNYDNRYFLTATVRRDGSSRFGEGNKWGVFPSAAASWRVSQEDFFKSDFISDLKLRASYGVTGNQEIGNLNSITTLGASTQGYLVGGERITIVLPQQYANPDLKWEETSQLDIGLNFGLFNHRVYGNIDYYHKKTQDLLLQIAVPSPSVISTQLANVGSVENKGVEIELGADIMNKDDFGWSANLNFSRNRNKVLSLSNKNWSGDDIKTAPLQGQGLSGIYAQLITPGKPIGTFYGKVFTGIENGEEQFEAEEQVIGNAQPDFTYGISNTFNYKNWSLVANIRGSVGNDVFNLTGNNLGYMSNLPGRNVFTSAVTSGVSRDQPKQFSSRWIEDGSFMRLDNVTLSYDFNLVDSFLSRARVYLSGQNLFLITGYSGLDPEVNSDVSGSGVAPLGIDYLSYPKSRTITLGANISF
ncbi:TonB-dependent receptor [Echinicola jeungdonensis]|uniref:SusC/RagA family TonB-linked outer membrane protein n=1 Tax=Echinicola jeungdonensis TaxID=709343 RepID=A0ABV5J3J0_9BACT|nr:TonB-dependent receptor [Echinicola jeungdonensis]MDN3668925.1 TonB-dependent receptor [Echinicola jeungdonensis]